MRSPGIGSARERDGGFEHGGWTWPYWHDDIAASFAAMMQDTDAFLLGRRMYLAHAGAGKNILTDGSSQLVHALLAHDLVDELHLLLCPLTLDGVKRLLPEGVRATH